MNEHPNTFVECFYQLYQQHRLFGYRGGVLDIDIYTDSIKFYMITYLNSAYDRRFSIKPIS